MDFFRYFSQRNNLATWSHTVFLLTLNAALILALFGFNISWGLSITFMGSIFIGISLVSTTKLAILLNKRVGEDKRASFTLLIERYKRDLIFAASAISVTVGAWVCTLFGFHSGIINADNWAEYHGSPSYGQMWLLLVLLAAYAIWLWSHLDKTTGK